MHLAEVVVRVFLALGLLFVSLAAPAGAQDEGRFPVGSSLSITPGVSWVIGRDSNLIRTDTGTPSNEFYIVPQIEGWLGRGRTRVNFASAFEYAVGEFEQTVNSSKNQFHSLHARTGPARVQFGGLASYRNHYAPPTDFVGFELGLRSRRVETTVEGTVDITPGGRIRYQVRGVRNQLRYDADAKFEGSSLQDNLNRNSDAFGGSVAVALTPLTAFTLSGEATQESFLYATERDGVGYRVFGGAEFKPLAVLAGSASLGYIRFSPKSVGIPYGGPYYRMSLSTSKGPWGLIVAGERSVNFSFDPSKGFFIGTGVDVYSTVRTVAGIELFGRGALRRIAPQGQLAAEEPFRGISSLKSGVVYRVGRFARIGVDGERYVTGGPGGFDGVRITTFFIYGTERVQRLDRPLPGSF